MWPGGYLPPVKCHRRVDVIQRWKRSVTFLMHFNSISVHWNLFITRIVSKMNKSSYYARICTTAPLMHNVYCMCQHVGVLAEKRIWVRQDAENTVSIVQSVIQSVSKSVNSLAGGSFELSSKRNSLSPWCINSACALFPTAALLQSKEVGLLSIQIFSFVPMFSRQCCVLNVEYKCLLLSSTG